MHGTVQILGRRSWASGPGAGPTCSISSPAHRPAPFRGPFALRSFDTQATDRWRADALYAARTARSRGRRAFATGPGRAAAHRGSPRAAPGSRTASSTRAPAPPQPSWFGRDHRCCSGRRRWSDARAGRPSASRAGPDGRGVAAVSRQRPHGAAADVGRRRCARRAGAYRPRPSRTTARPALRPDATRYARVKRRPAASESASSIASASLAAVRPRGAARRSGVILPSRPPPRGASQAAASAAGAATSRRPSCPRRSTG